MRIHSDILTNRNLIDAVAVAEADFDRWEDKGSRIRDHAFDVTLTGKSRRRPNNTRWSSEYAATWDQWGVFLAVLFDIDPNMLCGSGEKYAIYRDREDFQFQTNGRFTKIGGGWDNYWPADTHGDHTFEFSGIVGQQECTKCSAVKRRF